jgi:hypothetical protein
MVKKGAYLLLSIGILYAGYIAAIRLQYWERSIRIFLIDDSQFIDEGRGRRDFGRPDRTGESPERERFYGNNRQGHGFQRNEMRQMNDSTRGGYARGREPMGMAGRNNPDSLRRQFRPGNERSEVRSSFERGVPGRQGREHGAFPGGKRVSLRNVIWFLAVFASFAVLAIYIDKAYCLVRKRRAG